MYSVAVISTGPASSVSAAAEAPTVGPGSSASIPGADGAGAGVAAVGADGMVGWAGATAVFFFFGFVAPVGAEDEDEDDEDDDNDALALVFFATAAAAVVGFFLDFFLLSGVAAVTATADRFFAFFSVSGSLVGFTMGGDVFNGAVAAGGDTQRPGDPPSSSSSSSCDGSCGPSSAERLGWEALRFSSSSSSSSMASMKAATFASSPSQSWDMDGEGDDDVTGTADIVGVNNKQKGVWVCGRKGRKEGKKKDGNGTRKNFSVGNLYSK
jgi:hypothetical protein